MARDGAWLLHRRRRRAVEARSAVGVVFVEGLALQERVREVVETLAVLVQQSQGALVALLHDRADLGVDDLAGLLRRAAAGPREEDGVVAGAGEDAHEANAVRHAPAPDHLARDVRDLLEVGLRAGRDVAVDDLLRRAPAERADD